MAETVALVIVPPAPSNKELKLTKPAQAMELRSLTPVFGGLVGGRMASTAIHRQRARVVAVALMAAIGPTTAVSSGPPVKDHSSEMLQMASELGFALDYDDAPKPKRIVKPEYPKQALQACLEGTVVVLIGIDATGAVSATKVVESIEGLDEAAIACVKTWRFKPARKRGKAVGSVASAPLVFRIYDDSKQRGACEGKTTSPLE